MWSRAFRLLAWIILIPCAIYYAISAYNLGQPFSVWDGRTNFRMLEQGLRQVFSPETARGMPFAGTLVYFLPKLLFQAAFGFLLGNALKPSRRRGNGPRMRVLHWILPLVFPAVTVGTVQFEKVQRHKAAEQRREERRIHTESTRQFELLTLSGSLAGFPITVPAGGNIRPTALCAPDLTDYCEVNARTLTSGAMGYGLETIPELQFQSIDFDRTGAECLDKPGGYVPFCIGFERFDQWCARRPDLEGQVWCDTRPVGELRIRAHFDAEQEARIAANWTVEPGGPYGTVSEGSPIRFGCVELSLSVLDCGTRYRLAPGVDAWIDLHKLPPEARRDALPDMIHYADRVWAAMTRPGQPQE